MLASAPTLLQRMPPALAVEGVRFSSTPMPPRPRALPGAGDLGRLATSPITPWVRRHELLAWTTPGRADNLAIIAESASSRYGATATRRS
jgi:hypothetical protein